MSQPFPREYLFSTTIHPGGHRQRAEGRGPQEPSIRLHPSGHDQHTLHLRGRVRRPGASHQQPNRQV